MSAAALAGNPNEDRTHGGGPPPLATMGGRNALGIEVGCNLAKALA